MAMRHDEAFKFLFDLPEVCADTLRVAAPALWPHLDPASGGSCVPGTAWGLT